MKKILINLRDLVNSPLGTKEVFSVNSKITSPDKENILIKSPLYGKTKFTNLGKSIIGEFELKIKLGFTCSRCGEGFSEKITLKNDILPAMKSHDYMVRGGVSFSARRGNDAFIPALKSRVFRCGNKKNYQLSDLTKDQNLDILPEINEEIILSLPIKPLCKKNCAGLCSLCGQNLNLKKCNCKIQVKAEANKPFAKLKTLIKNHH